MTHKWRDVRKPLSPEAEKRIQESVKQAAAVMTLHQLREAWARHNPPKFGV